MTLRWEKQESASFYAYSGDMVVGMIVQRDHGQAWTYNVDAVRTRWICKGHGEVKTAASARRAFKRAWGLWLAHANLSAQPAPSQVGTEPTGVVDHNIAAIHKGEGG